MTAPEPLVDQDREDVPFLNSEHASPVPPRQLEKDNVTAKQVSFRLKVGLFLMILAVEVGFAFLEGPMIRIMESIACRQYYSVADPTKIDAFGQVPEDQCKIAEVQTELAAVKGYHMFFDGTLSALLAFPYGLLADRVGRRHTLILGLPGFAINATVTIVVLWFSDIFPLRAIWFSCLGWLIGGGPVPAFAIIWTMMADVTTDSERATLFFQFAIVSMGADFITSAFSSYLMVLNPWIPFIIGFIVVLGGLMFILVLPETKHVHMPRSPEPSNVELSELSNVEPKDHPKPHLPEPYGENEGAQDHESHMTWSYPSRQHSSLWARLRVNLHSYVKPYLFIFRRKSVLLMLTAFLVYRLSRGSSWFLTQYISTRYSWTLAQANLLVSCRPTISIPLFLFVLPMLKKHYFTPRHSATQKDLYLARASIFCLTLGTLGIGLSPSVSTLIPSMIVQASGSGFVFLARSIITTLVERDETARLYTVVEIIQSLGNVVASLSITTVFQIGLRIGGFWIGLAWMMTSSLFCMVGVAIFLFKLPTSPPTTPEFVVGEFDDDA